MKKNLFYGFLMALIGGIASISLYKAFETEIPMLNEQSTSGSYESRMVKLITPEPTGAVDYVTVAEASIDGVVHVTTAGTMEYSRQAFDPFRYFFEGDGRYEQKHSQPIRGAGSGVIVSPDGYIVTNNHVIENADKIKVTLNNKRSYDAELIGHDATTDIAVLKIKADDLQPLSYGNSDELRIGEWVLAVGNPFNLTSTVTAGIVSAKSRNINILGNDPISKMSSIESFIQTDAAVNPGNSGGALVNTKGELVGINTAIKSNTGSYAGYSFAIPSNIVKKVVNDIVEYGHVQRAFIGIHIRNIDSDFAKENKIDDLNGVYVLGLADGNKDADLKEGDIIKSVNGTNTKNTNELQAKIGEYHPGDKVEIVYLRKGKLKTSSITLKNREGNTEIITSDNTSMLKLLGVELEEVDAKLKEKLSIDNGVLVKKVYPGKLQKSGIQDGFIITAINNEAVGTVDELIASLENKKGGVLVQGVYPNGRKAYYGFGM